MADGLLAAAERCLAQAATALAAAERPWDGERETWWRTRVPRIRSRSLLSQPWPSSLVPLGFTGLISVSEDDAWGSDAPRDPPASDPAIDPPLPPLLADLVAREAAALEAAFGPARALVGGGPAPAPPSDAPDSSTSTPPISADALESAALAALDAGDVAGAVAHLQAAAAACEGVPGATARRARIARYLAAAQAVLDGA